MENTEKKQVPVEVHMFKTGSPILTDYGSATYKSGLDVMRQKFISATEKLCFRLITSVKASSEDGLGTTFLEPSGEGFTQLHYSPGNEPLFTEQQEERNIERYAKKFFCMTSEVPIRPGTPGEKNRDSFLLRSENYAQLDFFNDMSFEFRPPERPYILLPVVGDMVCFLPGDKVKNPEAKYWFVCSPQFLRTWTLIHFKEHDSIRKLVPNNQNPGEEAIRKKVFSGNTTMTNSYLGWILSCQQNGLVSEERELKNKFWCLRTEDASRNFVHVYSALVLMLRYAELPGPNNIPNKLDKSPKFLEWNLPVGWIVALFDKYGLEIHQDPAVRFVDAPPPLEVPKGTYLNVKPERQNWGDCVVEENM